MEQNWSAASFAAYLISHPPVTGVWHGGDSLSLAKDLEIPTSLLHRVAAQGGFVGRQIVKLLFSLRQVPAWVDDRVPFLLPEDDRSSSKGQGAAYQGFTFTVRSFPVLVEALGLNIPLLKNLASKSNSSEITVELSDSVSKQLIYHVSFNQSDLKTTKREAGYLYKDLKNR